MSEINNELLLEKYETLLLVVDDLQSKIVKLTNFYEQVKEKYNVYDTEVEKALNDMRSTKKKVVDEISSTVTTAEKDLSKAIADIKTLLKELSKASYEVNAVIKTASEFELSFPEFEKRLSSLEQQVKNGVIGSSKYISFDYDEVLTAAEIWQKYNGKTRTPIVVKASNWRGDYCMVMTGYNKNTNRVAGRIYLNGQLHTATGYPNGRRTFSGNSEFSVYKSPNLDDILESEEDEE